MSKWHPIRKEINHLFTYSKSKGVLIWKNAPEPNEKRLRGKVAGTIDRNGYRVVMIRKKMFKVHRIIWFLETDCWPNVVDHISGNRIENQIKNLRDGTHRQNTQNTYNHRNGKLLGAHFHKPTNIWRSHIVKNGKQIHLGSFSSAIEANKAYLKALPNV